MGHAPKSHTHNSDDQMLGIDYVSIFLLYLTVNYELFGRF